MLDVYERRLKYPKGMVFASSLLDSALYGKPDFAPEVPNYIRRLAGAYGKSFDLD